MMAPHYANPLKICTSSVDSYLQKHFHLKHPRNLRGNQSPLFDTYVNVMEQWPYCMSHLEVSYCIFGFGVIIQYDLRTLASCDDHHATTIVCTWVSPHGKGDSTFLSRLSYEKIWRYNNSSPYVTARWLPLQIPPFNVLGNNPTLWPAQQSVAKRVNVLQIEQLHGPILFITSPPLF